MRGRFGLTLSLLVVFALVLAACGGGDSTETTEGGSTETTAAGGGEEVTLRVLIHQNPTFTEFMESYNDEFEAANSGVTVDMTEGHGSGTSYDFDFTIESEVGVGGVTFGMSLGFQYGYEYWETNSESTFFEGTVGDIPSDAFTADMAYTFGLFAYPFEHEGQKFTVVSYWVN